MYYCLIIIEYIYIYIYLFYIYLNFNYWYNNNNNNNNNKKGIKRIALFHVNGNGDPDETQRASPQVQAYIKAFEQMDNVIVDIYPDNEAKFNLPYQYIAPFPVQVTDHLYWSETTLGK